MYLRDIIAQKFKKNCNTFILWKETTFVHAELQEALQEEVLQECSGAPATVE